MSCWRIFTDSAGETHFGETEVDLTEASYAPPAPAFLISEAFTAERLLMARLPQGWEGDWHPSPALQYYIQLSGTLQVTVSDGEVRMVGPGAIVLLEDLDGKGHVTKVIGGDAEGLFVRIA